MKKYIRSFQNSMLPPFIPWIFFAVFYGASEQAILVASGGALVLALLFNYQKLRQGFVLPWGTVVLFSFLLINEWSGWIELGALGNLRVINSTLAVIVLFSMVIGRPFTLQYARKLVPPAQWNNPKFIQINWVLTSIWAVLMVVMALPSYIFSYEALRASWFLNYGLTIVCIVIGMRCNKWVPKMMR